MTLTAHARALHDKLDREPQATQNAITTAATAARRALEDEGAISPRFDDAHAELDAAVYAYFVACRVNPRADTGAEGWALFDFDGTGLMQIQRVDEDDVFPDDAAALRFVSFRAQAGSPAHAAALAQHERDTAGIAALADTLRCLPEKAASVHPSPLALANARMLAMLRLVAECIDTSDPEHESFMDSAADTLQCLLDLEPRLRDVIRRAEKT